MTILINHMWLPAPCDLTLLQDDVHVWRIELDQPEAQLKSLLQTLSSDERSRAERFYQKQHRHRFIAGRGILRCILGRYLNIDPSALKFNYEPLGKPVLADTYGGKKLWFNLSHSQGLALCAVSCDRLIGVDLEYIRPISDVISLAEQFFSTSEYALMRSLPTSLKQQTFFRYWTCKEAYLKATGAGLAQLDKIEVSLTPGQPASLQAVPDWSLLEMEPAKNCVAAIAVAGFGWYLKCWQY